MLRQTVLCPCTLAASYGGGQPARLWGPAGRVLLLARRRDARTLCISAAGGNGLDVVVVGGGAAGMVRAGRTETIGNPPAPCLRSNPRGF